MKLTRNISLFFICSSLVFGATLPTPKLPKFPRHIEQCIDGFLYRAFVDERDQIIPTSIHQVFVKTILHEKTIPQVCKNDLKDKKSQQNNVPYR